MRPQLHNKKIMATTVSEAGARLRKTFHYPPEDSEEDSDGGGRDELDEEGRFF